ncbi:MAG: SulP family inorganic anion transporter [Pseudomonadota bacterium]
MPEPSRLSQKSLTDWIPLVDTVRRYRFADLWADLPAALTVALFAIPQAMAYAMVAGVPPVHGLYAAVIACLLTSVFQSSQFLINGPANAMSVMLASNVALFAAGGDPLAMVLVLTVVAGLLQIGMGLLGLGTVTRFVSTPVLHGFAAGAGVYIVANQLPALLGLHGPLPRLQIGDLTLERTCVVQVIATATRLGDTHLASVALGFGTFAAIRLMRIAERRWKRRLPSTLLGLVLATVASELLRLGAGPAGPHRVQVVADIQHITRHLPSLTLPDLTLIPPTQLLGPALVLAILGTIEAIAIARTLADRSGHNFDPNQQLVAQGIGNMGAGLFGGIASTGSFTRSAVNFEAGARTRMSGVLAGVMVMVLVLAFGPLADRIPVPALAGSLVHVATILVDRKHLQRAMATTRADRFGLLVTFGAVLVLSHLEQALFLGIGISLALAMRRAHRVEVQRLVEGPDGELHEAPLGVPGDAPVTMLNVEGELFFAAVDQLESALRPFTHGGVLVLRMRSARNLDATICEALARLAEGTRQAGGHLVLCGIMPGAVETLRRAGLLGALGPDAIFPAEVEVYGASRKAMVRAHRLAGDRAP